MRYNLIILAFLTITLNTYSQDSIALPTQDGKILIQEIVPLTDTTAKKDKIYIAVKEWISKAFKSSNSVIDLDDKEAGKIICKGTYRSEKKSNQILAINFTMNITIKDGKYRLQIYGLNGKEENYKILSDQINTFYPYTELDFEKMNYEYNSNPSKTYYRRKYSIDILTKTSLMIKTLIGDLQTTVNKNLAGLSSDNF